MIDWITAKITCTHNPEILSSGRSIRTKKLMVLSVWNTKLATVWSFLALMMQILLSAPIPRVRSKYRAILRSSCRGITYLELMI